MDLGSSKFWFHPDGCMARGWADVDDAYKRYFDDNGQMLKGWQTIGGKRYYFRASGAMQTGKATIDGEEFEFSDKGVLISGGNLTAQEEDSMVLVTHADDGDEGTEPTKSVADEIKEDEIDVESGSENAPKVVEEEEEPAITIIS